MFLSRSILFLCVVATLAGQTKVDVPTQTKNADFSGVSSNKPFRWGSTLPGICTEGDVYLKTPEAILYLCYPNTWIPLADGAGEGAMGSLARMSDFAVAASGATATLGSTCSVAAPCNAAFGAQTFSFTNPATVSSLTGLSTASTVYLFIAGSGVRTLGVPGTAGATVSNMALMNNVTSFPNDSLPLASCAVLNNQFTSCTDFRAFLRGFNIAGTNGINVTRTANGFLLDSSASAGVENPTFGPVMNAGSATQGNLNLPATYDGTNTNRAQIGASGEIAVVRFPSTETGMVTFSQALAEEWTGPVDADVWWTVAAGSGNVQWKASTSCVQPGGTAAYTWNAFATSGPQAASAGTVRKSSFTGAAALPVAGCSAGSLMRVAIMRDNSVSGNAGGEAHLLSVRLKVRKTN